ncbi:MAG: hypothetical protein EBT91_07125 [Rhodobacteraceae bacterium]|nr:hypothetical protein [Paracoccaceae bacterium]
MSQAAAAAPMIAEEDQLRADLYGYLSALLASPPDKALLGRSATLKGDESDLGSAINTLATLASKVSAASVEREFNDLFIGLGRGELLPYASYYMTGFLNEKPLAVLRDDMRKNGITRAPKPEFSGHRNRSLPDDGRLSERGPSRLGAEAKRRVSAKEGEKLGMTKSTEDKATSRRDFLKIASAAPVAAAAAAAGTEAAADTASGAGGSGLQDTAHTRAYYESARF